MTALLGIYWTLNIERLICRVLVEEQYPPRAIRHWVCSRESCLHSLYYIFPSVMASFLYFKTIMKWWDFMLMYHKYCPKYFCAWMLHYWIEAYFQRSLLLILSAFMTSYRTIIYQFILFFYKICPADSNFLWIHRLNNKTRYTKVSILKTIKQS